MAGSGGGKDHARSCIKEAFIAAGLQRYLGGNRIASGSGLLTALYRQPSSLFQLDEFGQFLGNVVNKRHAPKYLAEIWDLLTELYTSAGGTFFGAEYADQNQRPRQDIAQPCCCVHATTVPESFWAALQEGSMVDGSLARFLVFQTDDDVPDRNRRPKPVSEVPGELIEALQAIAAGVPGHGRGNIAALVEGPMIVPDPYPVPMAPDAEQLFDGLDEELTAQSAGGGRHGPQRGARTGVGEHSEGGVDQGRERQPAGTGDPASRTPNGPSWWSIAASPR